MPEHLRLQEDTEHAELSRSSKPRGERAFLQKYHHKGAFYAVRVCAWPGLALPLSKHAPGLRDLAQARFQRSD